MNNCCPICGYEFDIVEEINICPVEHYGLQTFYKEELISDNDDYTWCL